MNQVAPNSAVDLISGEAFKNAVSKVPSDLWEKEESALRALAKPTKTDYALRLALWNEIRLAQGNGQEVSAARVYTGICSYQHFYQNLLQVPAKLVWLLQPLKEYEESLEPLLIKIAERYSEILDMDVRDSKGRPNPALLRIQLDAMKTVENRLRGGAVQRTENKNLNVQIDDP